MRTFIRSTLVALLLGAVTAPLMAQDIRAISSGPERAGFWWGLGLGVAQADVKCPSCPNVDPESFPILDIHLGGTLSPRWTLGVQLTGGKKDGAFTNPSTVSSTVGDMNVSAYFYPSASGNLWLQGGVTGAVYEETAGSSKATAVGGGLTLGGGYDFRFGRNTSITPSLRGVFGGKTDLKDENAATLATDFQMNFIQLGVSVIWH